MRRRIKNTEAGIYFLLWVLLTFFLLYLVYDYKARFLPQFVATLFVTGLTTVPAYISSRILVPKFLYRKLILRFIGFLVLISFANTIFTYLLAGVLYLGLSGNSIFTNSSTIQIVFLSFFIINAIVIAVSSAIRIIMDRFGMEQHLHEVENEKISTELAFLRAQINPHFLFNVLNTIYFQIQKENVEAKNSVEKLSEMLRYQLYECNTDKIDILKELAYIENYVAVQRLRMEAGTDLQLKLPADIRSFKIAPLLILPLVENAFKHISNYKNPSQNKLYITINTSRESTFIVDVVNTYNSSEGTELLQNSSGLGLRNLKRRLALLYPGRHMLTAGKNGDTYETTLKISYHD